MTQHPNPDLPELPEGYLGDVKPTFLAWAAIETRLIEARHYWLATTYPDGRPHVVPRWGVWVDGAFWYDGSPETRHVRNLEANSECVLHLESGETVTIVEGVSLASEPVHGVMGERLSSEYARKYGPMYTPSPEAWSDASAGGLRVLRPAKALAWSSFPADVTRFTF
jgi:hypothetical protein